MHVGAQIWQLAAVIRINLLYSQTALIIAGPGFTQYRMRVSNTFTVNVMFCPLKANTRRSCNRNKSKQYTNTWCQTQRRNTQITAEIMQTYDLLKFTLARSKNDSSFFPYNTIRNALHKQEWSDKKIERPKTVNTANAQMARTVGVVFGMSVLFTSLRIASTTAVKYRNLSQL